MTDEERRRLTDNQLIQRFADSDRAHEAINSEVDTNHRMIAELRDEMTEFRFESRTQFDGIGECINEMKAWQYDQDRKQEADQEHRARREQTNDQVYAEMLENFKFTRKLRRVIYSSIGGAAVIFGLISAGFGLWNEIKHLFQGAP
jgi:hypothetical protein